MSSYIDPGGKLLANLDRVAALQAGEVMAPVNAEIDLSNRCSLGCEWCHFAYTHTRGPLKGTQDKPDGAILGGDLMDAELAFRIIDQLAEAGVRSVTWTGGGEPTLHPDFDRIVSYAASRIKQGIYTHGGHLNEFRAGLLKQHFSWVYVSLDAADAEDYKAAKGVDRFQNACDGIRRLVSAHGDATVGVGYLVTEGNYRRAMDAARMVHNLGADYIQFRPTVRYDAHAPGEISEDTGWLEEAIAYLKVVGRAFPGFVNVDADRFRAYQDWAGHPYETCFWAAVQTVITPNGKVWTCANKREYAGNELGDLGVESFADVWARRKTPAVDGQCRAMCRGHLPNLALDEMLKPRQHPEFV